MFFVSIPAREIPLEKITNGDFIYSLKLEKIPEDDGIYIFARQWGKSYEALYRDNLKICLHNPLIFLVGRAGIEPATNGLKDVNLN